MNQRLNSARSHGERIDPGVCLEAPAGEVWAEHSEGTEKEL